MNLKKKIADISEFLTRHRSFFVRTSVLYATVKIFTSESISCGQLFGTSAAEQAIIAENYATRMTTKTKLIR